MTNGNQVVSADSATLEISGLIERALKGLMPMFDVESRLFCHRLKQDGDQLTREGLSQRYTIMTLLGLQRSENAGLKSPIEILPVLEGLLQDTAWASNIGDLGLLLWICAASSPERLPAGNRTQVDRLLSSIPWPANFQASPL